MGASTEIGFINTNGQEVLGPTGLPGTDHGQSIYVLKCRSCAQEYGANGTDIHIRRCPNCGGGRPGFAVTAADVVDLPARASGSRNPPWTRDELILALDVYMDKPQVDQDAPVVRELSALLNQLWAGSDYAHAENLRSPSGVSMKLSNFQRLDPRYRDRGRKGLAHGAKGDEEVWKEFAHDRPRLRATAQAIRHALLLSPQVATQPDLSGDVEASEGAVLTRMHHYRERDAGLAKKRKAQALALQGRLDCEACGFDFEKVYGARGKGFIEVHHTKPLETLQPGHRTKLSDLAILCANCHRMVHARRPWLSMAELKGLVGGDLTKTDDQTAC